MLSKRNWTLVSEQLVSKGIEDLNQNNWDNFKGWKRRGRIVQSGEKGTLVKIISPRTRFAGLGKPRKVVEEYNPVTGKKEPVFFRKPTFYFHRDQTIDIPNLVVIPITPKPVTPKLTEEEFIEKVLSMEKASSNVVRLEDYRHSK